MGLAERSQPGGFVPEEHLEDHDVDMQQRDETDNDVGNGGHRLSHGGKKPMLQVKEEGPDVFEALNEGLFRAYFTEGRNRGALPVL